MLARLARVLGHISVMLTALTVGGLLLLVLIGVPDRYEHQVAANQGISFAVPAEGPPALFAGPDSNNDDRDPSPSVAPGALGFSDVHEGDFASQVDPAEQTSAGELLAREQRPKLVGIGALGTANQGMSVALSADGNTAILGGPGPNNVDRDRPPSIGPAGAAWVFTRRDGVWTQQEKLVGNTDAYGGGLWSQGMSVALSADGNTAIVGGPSDNRTTGAAWVFARNGTIWTQQGSKLAGTGGLSAAHAPLPLGQGMSVALSGDGDTAIVGGWGTDGAWVFSRGGDVWTLQGKKLVGSGAVGRARQGMSVALSADGNTAIVGGWSDNSRAGAAWVFVRNGDVWSQQGKKLVGTDAVGPARQGTSVALSADGNTAIIGGPGDNPWDRSVPFGMGAAGAAWVFTRIGGVWIQQGDKLAGGSLRGANQGTSVALSGDGNTAVVGGFGDEGGLVGWRASVFTRSEGHWKQEKLLIGAGAVGKSAPSVALSDDGSTIMVGGANDNGGVGAAWVFRRSGSHWIQETALVDTEVINNSNPSVAAPTEGADAMLAQSNDSERGAALISPINGGGSTLQERRPASISYSPAWNWEE